MKKRFLALALGTLAFGVTLGGVKMGLDHQDAMMVKAAGENQVAYKTLSFPDDNKATNGIAGYNQTWTARIGDDSYSITNFNNNKWNNSWKFIKCGREKAASVASIVNKAAMAESIVNVQIAVDAINDAYVNSFKLLVSDDAKFTTTKGEYDIAKQKGSQSIAINNPAKDLFYKIVIDCANPNSKAKNGFVQISKIEFFAPGSTEPASPVKSISASFANPDVAFYAGDKVTLDDFVITATHDDTTTSVLKSDVTIENPVLTEGENVIKFHYVSGEISLECQLIVNAVKGNFFTKTTNVADIVVGKKIYIANTDGTAIIGTQNDNNRVPTTVATREGKIAAQDSYCSFLVLPAKNGTFALYDEINKGVLYAAGSGKGKNYLRTQKVFDSIDANSFANITYSKTWSIQFTGSNTNKNLRYNSQSDVFSCYSSGQAAPSIYVSPDAPVSFKADAWADSFIANVSGKCDATGETATWTADWDKAKAVFDGFGIPDKMAVLYGTGSEKVNQAIATYKFIVDKYSIDDYLGLGTKANALMLPGATDSTTWTLVGIGAVTIAASASLLFFRRKKSN